MQFVNLLRYILRNKMGSPEQDNDLTGIMIKLIADVAKMFVPK